MIVLAFTGGTFLLGQNQDAYPPAPEATQPQPYEPQPQPYDQQQAPAQAPEPQYPAQQNQAFSPDELRNLAAPIALYPDALLSQILVASTYPQEVIDADGWLQEHRYLRGRELMMAAQQQNWDPSVQALVAFPDVLTRMNADVQWMTDLGNAFVAQQAEVMKAIQELRAEARERGGLRSTPQFQVETETQGPRGVIEIVPANPQVIYVPSYDPYVVWGPPVYGAYPAVPYATGSAWGAVFTAVADIAGLLPGFAGWFGPRSWGWALGWLANALFVNNGFFHSFGFHWSGAAMGSSVWVHDWHHRLGVPYGRDSVAYWNRRLGPDRAGRHGFAARNENGRAYAGYRPNAREGFDRGGENGWRAFNRSGDFGHSSSTARGLAPTRSYDSQSRASGFAHFPAARNDEPARNTTANRAWSAPGNFSSQRLNHERGASYARSLNAPHEKARSYATQSRSARSSFRESSSRESSFGRSSGRESSRSFRQASSSHKFSSHAPKAAHYSAPKMPKAPKMKMAKSHGGGHSSGGHASRRSHRG